MRVQHARSSERVDRRSTIGAPTVYRKKTLRTYGLNHRLPCDDMENAILASPRADIAHVAVNTTAIGRHNMQSVPAVMVEHLHRRRRHQHNCAETQAISRST